MIVGRTKFAAFFAPEGAGGAAGAGGPGDAGAGGAGAAPGFAASLPEPLRGEAALKDVKDVGDLAGRYLAATKPKPFAETLPEDIRAEAVFKDIKDLEGLARGFHGQARLLGVPKDQLVRLPAADADDKALGELYAKLGRPESADKYVLKPAAGQKDFSETDRAFHAAILPAVHAAGLNQRQLDGLTAAWNGFAAKTAGEAAAKTKAAMDEAAAALRTEWGGEATFKQRLERADAALKHYAAQAKIDPKALGADLERDGLGNRPALARLLDHLGAQLEEDGTLKGRAAGGGAGTSPTEAKQQIAALAADAEFQKAWRDKDHPKHGDAVKRRAALFEMAYPAGA